MAGKKCEIAREKQELQGYTNNATVIIFYKSWLILSKDNNNNWCRLVVVTNEKTND